MDERQEIITIVFSIVGFISMIMIISFIIWYFLRRRRRSKLIANRQQYQRPRKLSTIKVTHNRRRRRKRRFNTNDSSISFSFNPPHLINRNVKNLDQLTTTDSSLHYEEGYSTNDINRYYANSATDPVYTSASSMSTNAALVLQMNPHSPQLKNLRFQFLNELNHVLCVKRERTPTNLLKYSQSSRQQSDQLPFDYSRSITPSVGYGSNQYLFEPNSRRIINHPTITRRPYSAKFRDDTAILY